MTSEELLAAVLDEIKGLRADMKARPQAPSGAQTSGGPVTPAAADSDLDGQYGNEPVYKDPPRWKGQSYKGVRLSECPSDYLDALAEFHEWKAANPLPGKEGNTAYSTRDAARCRGWAARARVGGGGQGATRASGDPPPDFGGKPSEDDDIPFAINEAHWIGNALF